MAVLIGGLVPRTTVIDDDMVQIEGAFGIHSLTFGGHTYVYVAGFRDDGISVFELGPDGSLTNLDNWDGGPPTGPLELDQAANFATAILGDTAYLYVNAADDDGISAFRINPSGQLTNIQNIPDDALLQLDDTAGEMSVGTVGGTSFLIASGHDDDGLSVFRIGADGTLTSTYNVHDDNTLNMKDAFDTASVVVGGRTFVFVASDDDNGISAFELNADGTLTNTDNINDDASPALVGAWGLATAEIAGTTYLISTSALDAGLGVFSVDGSGKLTNVFNLPDSPARGLDGASAVSTFTIDNETFVAVSSRYDDALSVYHLAADGVLTDVTAVFDDAGVTLWESFGNAFAEVGGVPYLIAGGKADNGVTVFEIGGGDDSLVGTKDADTLLGLGGNDYLDGAGGKDRMVGGTGDDTYAVDNAGDSIEELVNAGLDTVRASTDHALGSNLENLVLLGGAALDGAGNELANILSGNTGSNRLQGMSGKDKLYGSNGGDVLEGGKGRDCLYGGKGNDDLIGGKSKDILRGNQGHDDFIFTKVSDSGVSNNMRDRIEGFGKGDRIVLHEIDAVNGEHGDQDFHLDQDGNFEAGEIRFREVNAGLRVEMNIDGDAKAEMTIMLRDFHGHLSDSDFVF